MIDLGRDLDTRRGLLQLIANWLTQEEFTFRVIDEHCLTYVLIKKNKFEFEFEGIGFYNYDVGIDINPENEILVYKIGCLPSRKFNILDQNSFSFDKFETTIREFLNVK